MKNLKTYGDWKLNELRVLGTPFKIYDKEHLWEEIHRETIITNLGEEKKEIGDISFGLASIPSGNLWYSIINIEVQPISGFGSHQIMTVHQGEFPTKEEAELDLEKHYKTLQFKKYK